MSSGLGAGSVIDSQPSAKEPAPNPACSIEGCDKPVKARGWCRNHYMRWWKRGTTSCLTDEERFWNKVEKTATCWLWTGATAKGYGLFWLDGRLHKAHRHAYEMLVGPIPAGLAIDHVCHNDAVPVCRLGYDCIHRRCVRPDHLEPVTPSENQRRAPKRLPIGYGRRPRPTHCFRGLHELTPENSYQHPTTGTRRCRACRNEMQRQRRHEVRQLSKGTVT